MRLIATTLALLLAAMPAAAQTAADPEAPSGLAPKPLATARTLGAPRLWARHHPAAARRALARSVTKVQ